MPDPREEAEAELYDLLLMLGVGGHPRWTREELAAAPVEVVEAARWTLYAETLWPEEDELSRLEEPPKGWSTAQIEQAKRQGRTKVQLLREILFPPDVEATDG